MRGDLGSSLFAQFSISAQHYCRGWRPRQPLEATRFELSGICAEQHCADNINKIADETSRGRDVIFLQSRNCATLLHSLCVKSQYFASICCKLELCSQNTCRTSAHKHTLQENVKIVIHGADTFVYLQIKGYDLFISIYL